LGLSDIHQLPFVNDLVLVQKNDDPMLAHGFAGQFIPICWAHTVAADAESGTADAPIITDNSIPTNTFCNIFTLPPLISFHP
jgi:hypothetical protein